MLSGLWHGGGCNTRIHAVLKNGNRAYPVAADDNHNQPHKYRRVSDSFGGFNMIKAPELTYNSIIAALLQGHTYASTGPEIYEYVLDGMRLSITCSPVAKAILKTSSIGLNSQNIILQNNGLSHITFDLSNANGFACVFTVCKRWYLRMY